MRAHAAANRGRIVAAAAEVFGEQGSRGSTEEVARRAGVGIATVFRHFPTKDALVEEALLGHHADLQRRAAELADHPDPALALHELLAVLISTGGRKMTLTGLLGDSEPPPPAVLEAATALRDRVAQVLHRAQAAGVADPRVSSEELFLVIRGLSQATAAGAPEPGVLAGALRILERGLALPDHPSSPTGAP